MHCRHLSNSYAVTGISNSNLQKSNKKDMVPKNMGMAFRVVEWKAAFTHLPTGFVSKMGEGRYIQALQDGKKHASLW